MNQAALNQLALQQWQGGNQSNAPTQSGLAVYGGYYPDYYYSGILYGGGANTAFNFPKEPTLTGSKPVVVCSGHTEECETLELAQAKAEEMAHKHQADAFILTPKRKVAPKRDVVTTEL